MDASLIALLPGRPLALPAAVVDARAAMVAAVADLVAVPDAGLVRPWPWRGGTNDVRYGFYRQFERLEEARAAIRRILHEASAMPAPGGWLLADAAEARWALHGVLATMAPADLDADPGGGEWTCRQVLSHMIEVQDRYALGSAYAALGKPALPPLAEVPSYEGTAAGLDERLGHLLDHGIAYLGTLDDEALAIPARWAGFPVSVGFRLGRWGAHIREHTIQLEKTIDLLGRRRSEVDWLVRLVCGAWGRVEATVTALPPGALERAEASGRDGAGVVRAVATAVRRDAATLRAAASAQAVPRSPARPFRRSGGRRGPAGRGTGRTPR